MWAHVLHQQAAIHEDLQRNLRNVTRITSSHSATEQRMSAANWADILGTIQSPDQDNLNGVLVSNKWPPL